MQGQYGSADDRKLGKVASDLWREHGFRNGIMRGFWVTVAREIPAYAGQYMSMGRKIIYRSACRDRLLCMLRIHKKKLTSQAHTE